MPQLTLSRASSTTAEVQPWWDTMTSTVYSLVLSTMILRLYLMILILWPLTEPCLLFQHFIDTWLLWVPLLACMNLQLVCLFQTHMTRWLESPSHTQRRWTYLTRFADPESNLVLPLHSAQLSLILVTSSTSMVKFTLRRPTVTIWIPSLHSVTSELKTSGLIVNLKTCANFSTKQLPSHSGNKTATRSACKTTTTWRTANEAHE